VESPYYVVGEVMRSLEEEEEHSDTEEVATLGVISTLICVHICTTCIHIYIYIYISLEEYHLDAGDGFF
jgi:hypothetical protein